MPELSIWYHFIWPESFLEYVVKLVCNVARLSLIFDRGHVIVYRLLFSTIRAGPAVLVQLGIFFSKNMDGKEVLRKVIAPSLISLDKILLDDCL